MTACTNYNKISCLISCIIDAQRRFRDLHLIKIFILLLCISIRQDKDIEIAIIGL